MTISRIEVDAQLTLLFDFAERDGEDAGDLKTQVVDGISKTTLGLAVASVERLHRLGRKRCDSPRPALLSFYDYNEREKRYCLRTARDLKAH